MDDRLREIDARLRELNAAYAEILRRLDRLESRSARTTPPSGDAGASAPLPAPAAPTVDESVRSVSHAADQVPAVGFWPRRFRR